MLGAKVGMRGRGEVYWSGLKAFCSPPLWFVRMRGYEVGCMKKVPTSPRPHYTSNRAPFMKFCAGEAVELVSSVLAD
jgi:hypothetical protein